MKFIRSFFEILMHLVLTFLFFYFLYELSEIFFIIKTSIGYKFLLFLLTLLKYIFSRMFAIYIFTMIHVGLSDYINKKERAEWKVSN